MGRLTAGWVKVMDALPMNDTDQVMYFVVAHKGKPSGWLHQLAPGHGCDANYPVQCGFDSWLALPPVRPA